MDEPYSYSIIPLGEIQRHVNLEALKSNSFKHANKLLRQKSIKCTFGVSQSALLPQRPTGGATEPFLNSFWLSTFTTLVIVPLPQNQVTFVSLEAYLAILSVFCPPLHYLVLLQS
jgi:hypothetical protein